MVQSFSDIHKLAKKVATKMYTQPGSIRTVEESKDEDTESDQAFNSPTALNARLLKALNESDQDEDLKKRSPVLDFMRAFDSFQKLSGGFEMDLTNHDKLSDRSSEEESKQVDPKLVNESQSDVESDEF